MDENVTVFVENQLSETVWLEPLILPFLNTLITKYRNAFMIDCNYIVSCRRDDRTFRRHIYHLIFHNATKYK